MVKATLRAGLTMMVANLTTACGSRVLQPGGETADVDAVVSDSSVVVDQGVGLDAPDAADDVLLRVDAAAPLDVQVDAIGPTDVAAEGEVWNYEPLLFGRWQVDSCRYPEPDGGTYFIASGSGYRGNPDGGRPIIVGLNGVLELTRTHITFAVTTVVDSQPVPARPTSESDWDHGYTGYVARGNVTVDTMAHFRAEDGSRTIDLYFGSGNIELFDARSGQHMLLTRYSNPPTRLASISLHATVQQNGRVGRLTAPRAALLWDLPGDGAFRTTHDTPLSFQGSPPVAGFPIAFDGVPPDNVLGAVGSTAVGSAYLLVYDDRDGDGRYDRAVDETLAQGSLGLAWRGAGESTPALAASPFATLQPGWQIVTYRREVPTGRWMLAPFANDLLFSLRATVEETSTVESIELY